MGVTALTFLFLLSFQIWRYTVLKISCKISHTFASSFHSLLLVLRYVSSSHGNVCSVRRTGRCFSAQIAKCNYSNLWTCRILMILQSLRYNLLLASGVDAVGRRLDQNASHFRMPLWNSSVPFDAKLTTQRQGWCADLSCFIVLFQKRLCLLLRVWHFWENDNLFDLLKKHHIDAQ